MITLSCPSCQTKLKVKDELAGKKVRCPQCKQTTDIPNGTVAFEPAKPSLAEDVTVPPRPVSLNEDATVPPKPFAVTDAIPEPTANRNGNVDEDSEAEGEDLDAEAHYKVEGEIARGGMGAIMRAVDQDIRREVAVKFLLNHADAKMKARFVEEAQITGQLEHPNIVPIYQLGAHQDGRSFFSMKIVKGRSLAEILKESRKDETLGRLLNIFVSICNAMAYAHSRQVIHRDLKPANVMVGDFGEVYVMDWGLAKVLTPQEALIVVRRAPVTMPSDTRVKVGDPTGSNSGSGSSKVSTNRDSAGNLTQAGSIMGTPAYMPPEQAVATGVVDERSDIYSLGAILYEIMTRTPPVGHGGDMLAILVRVVEGQIDPPQTRSPQRAKAGWIPPELSAIAMKALATDPAKRYQTVEALRRDVELFLEGRSVSAKHDTFREMAWKLVKRNKAVSLAMAAAMLVLALVLGVAFKVNYDARVVAEKERNKANDNYAAFQQEQQEKREQARKSVPALVRAARVIANEGKFDDALAQATLAVGIDEYDANARSLRGQLLIGEQDYKGAYAEFKACLKIKPDDAAAQNLLKLCESARSDHSGQLLTLADELSRQKAFTLAARVTRQAEKLLGSRKELLGHYRTRIEAAWPGAGVNLKFNEIGQFSLSMAKREDVNNLGPLQGMKLNSLVLFECIQIRDLEPLKGMPLTTLSLAGCKAIRDLEPIKNLPLTTLDLTNCNQVRDLAPLKTMKLASLVLSYCPVEDLGPLKGMPLTTLNLSTCGLVRDLEPLKSMPLTALSLVNCQQVQTLEPLKGMSLTSLHLVNCNRISNLEPLKGMPLTVLDLTNCGQVRTLEPLKGMPLTVLNLISCGQVRTLEPLKGMPLIRLNLSNCTEVRTLEPLKGMPINSLVIGGTGVADLTPLQGMKLESVGLTPKNITQGLDILRSMESLKTIGGNAVQSWPAAEFWARYDKGEFKK